MRWWRRRCRASPTSAPAKKAVKACRPSCKNASPAGCSVPDPGRAMNALDTPQLLALAGALGWASGVRLYLVVLLTGLAGYLGWVQLPPGLHLLAHPVVLAASGFMVFV